MSTALAFLGIGGSFSTLAELVLVAAILAYSGYVVIAGGAYSFTFVAFIGIGAYTGAIMTVDHGLSLWLAMLVAPILSMVFAAILAKPLTADNSDRVLLAGFAVFATAASLAISRWIFQRALLSYRSASS